MQTLNAWLAAVACDAAVDAQRFVLSPDAAVRWDGATAGPAGTALTFLSGPEGGLTRGEEAAARRAGFTPVSLGARIMRADTAPLAILAWCGIET